MAEAAKDRGNALYKSGKFAEAVAAYDEAIALDDSIASVHANRAAALSGQGKAFFADAVRSCVTAVSLDPSYARARSRLGQLCTKLGSWTRRPPPPKISPKLTPTARRPRH
jgi:DnaJ family protein C protein 7